MNVINFTKRYSKYYHIKMRTLPRKVRTYSIVIKSWYRIFLKNFKDGRIIINGREVTSKYEMFKIRLEDCKKELKRQSYGFRSIDIFLFNYEGRGIVDNKDSTIDAIRLDANRFFDVRSEILKPYTEKEIEQLEKLYK